MIVVLPVFHDQAILRRWPWVSTVLLAVTAITWLGLIRPVRDAEDRLSTARSEAVEYWLAHPRLEGAELLPYLPPAMRRAVDGLGPDGKGGGAPGGLEDLAAQVEQALAGSPVAGAAAPPPAPTAEEAAELAARIAAVKDAARRHPWHRYGFVSASGDRPFSGWFTYVFLHADFLHLFSNMLLFWLAATALEDRWGRPFLGLFYLGAAAASALGFHVLRPDETEPMIGASGAVSALVGAFLVRFSKARIRFVYLTFYLRSGSFYAPAWLMIPLWAAGQVLDAMVPAEMRTVATEAHLAGLALGLGLAAAIRFGRVEERLLDPGTPEPADDRAARKVLADAEEAIRRNASDLDARARAAQASLDLGDLKAAARHGRPLVLALARAGRVDEAADAWRDLLRATGEPDVPPPQLLAIGQRLAARGESEAAASALRRFVEINREDPSRPVALLALGRILAVAPGTRLEARTHLDEAARLARAAGRGEITLAAAEVLAALDAEPEPGVTAATPEVPPTPSAPIHTFPPAASAELKRNLGAWMTAPAAGPEPPWAPPEAGPARGGAPSAPRPAVPTAAVRSDRPTGASRPSSTSARRGVDPGPGARDPLDLTPADPESNTGPLPDPGSDWMEPAPVPAGTGGTSATSGESAPVSEPAPAREIPRTGWLSADAGLDGDSPRPEDSGQLELVEPGDSKPPDQRRLTHPFSPPAESGRSAAPTRIAFPRLAKGAAGAGRSAGLPPGTDLAVAARPVHVVELEAKQVCVRDGLGRESRLRSGDVLLVACGRVPGAEQGSEEWLCDLVTAIDPRDARGTVRTVRLSSERTPFEDLFGRSAPSGGANFRRLLDQLRGLGPRHGWLPEGAGRFGGPVPAFDSVRAYEQAIAERARET